MLGVISLKKPQRKWASSRLEGKTSWIFSSWDGCSRLMTGTSGTRSGGLRKGQSPCEFLEGLSGFLSLRCWGLRPWVESGREPEDSFPVLTLILVYFWRRPRGVSPRLERGHNDQLMGERGQQESVREEFCLGPTTFVENRVVKHNKNNILD